jgi:hypothetical protein
MRSMPGFAEAVIPGRKQPRSLASRLGGSMRYCNKQLRLAEKSNPAHHDVHKYPTSGYTLPSRG